MIVAITGGTGFVGRGLTLRHLTAGDTVRVLTRRSLTQTALPQAVHLFYGDLTDSAEHLIPFVDQADLLYHCAAEIRDESRMQVVHVQGTKNLLSAGANRIERWIQLSSVGVYGRKSAGIVTEETPLNPIGMYERTKAESDQLVIEAAKQGTITLAILRPSIVFGSGMTNRSLYQMIAMIDKGLFFFIGKPGTSANYIHVDNVVEGLIRCAKMPEAVSQTYILSDRRTIEEFVSTICRVLGKKTPTVRLSESVVRWGVRRISFFRKMPLTPSRIDALTTRVSYSSIKIMKELKYTHQVSVEDGLRQLVGEWKRAK